MRTSYTLYSLKYQRKCFRLKNGDWQIVLNYIALKCSRVSEKCVGVSLLRQFERENKPNSKLVLQISK